MTVSELIEALRRYPLDWPVNIWVDTAYADHFDIKNVDFGRDLDNDTNFVVLEPEL